MSDLTHLRYEIRAFNAERGWERFHDPKSLILALVGEVGELAELFQWVEADRAVERFAEPRRRERAAEELSDILIYLVGLADVLDIDLVPAALSKLEAARHRYPPTDGLQTPAPEKS